MKKFQVKFCVLVSVVWLCAVSVVVGSTGAVAERNPRPVGTEFWNVIGSTVDERVDKCTWIGLWTSKVGVPRNCIVNDSNCNGGLVGGHIVFDSNYICPMKANASNSVYILPICRRHNSKAFEGAGRKMTTSANITAVQLINYKGRY